MLFGCGLIYVTEIFFFSLHFVSNTNNASNEDACLIVKGPIFPSDCYSDYYILRLLLLQLLFCYTNMISHITILKN